MSTTSTDALDATAGAVSGATRTARNLDGRLTIFLVRTFYVAMSFFFASFYFGLIFLQITNSNGLWLPRFVKQPSLTFGIIEVGLVIVAGLAYFWGQWAGLYARKWGRLQLGLWIAALLSIISCIMHIIELHQPGFGLQDGGWASLFIAIEGTFTVVLILTTVALLGIANRSRLGLFRESGIAVEAFGEFYGWIAAVALINFLGLYVQPFLPIG